VLCASPASVGMMKAVFDPSSRDQSDSVQGAPEESLGLLEIIEKNGTKFYKDCGNTYELEKVMHSNLGGHGPDLGEENIVWLTHHVNNGQDLGDVEVVMTAQKPYTPWTNTSLNGMHGKFGRVALPSGESVDVVLEFRDPKTKKPVTLPEVTMTFYDLDQGWEGSAVEFVRVVTEHKTLLHPDAQIKRVTLADGAVEYIATNLGGKADNPERPDDHRAHAEARFGLPH